MRAIPPGSPRRRTVTITAPQPNRSKTFGQFKWHQAWTIELSKREARHRSGLVYDFFPGRQDPERPPLGGYCPCGGWHGRLRGGLESLPSGIKEKAAVRLWLEASTLFSDCAILACQDCMVETYGDNYYMVHNDLWSQVHPNSIGMLCLDCLEGRLGRPLVKTDFTSAPTNYTNRRVAALREQLVRAV